MRFQKQVEEASKGSLKINAFLNSQLGIRAGHRAAGGARAHRHGRLLHDRGSLLVPELSLLNIPFLFKDQKEQDCVIDNHLTKVTQDLFLKKGVVMISAGARSASPTSSARSPYLRPTTSRVSRRARRPTRSPASCGAQFGANPNPLPVTEWNSAFQTGLIDVADSAPTFYFFSGLAKLAPVVTMTQHQDQGGVVIINKEAFDKLHGRAQGGARPGTATSAPASQLRAEVRGFEGKIREMHKAAGGTIVELTPEQRAVWRKGIEAAWPKMVEAVGGEAGAYWKAIQAGIKACSP